MRISRLAPLGFVRTPLLCLLAGAFAPWALSAQDQPQPSPDAAFLVQASKSYGIADVVKPWHLKLTFHMLDAQGSETDYGTYEEFSQSQFVSKRIYHSEHFSQTQYTAAGRVQNGVPGGPLATGDTRWPPVFFLTLRTAIVTPMINQLMMQRMFARPENWSITSEYRSIGGASLHCYDIARAGSTDRFNTTTYCFDDSNALARYTVGSFPMGDALFKNPVTFEGRSLPGDVVVELGNGEKLTAHLDSIEALGQVDAAFFEAPTDAKPLQPSGGIIGVTGAAAPPQPGNLPIPRSIAISAGVAAGMLLGKTDPLYPPIARAARVSGTVVLQVTIGKDGMIEDLRVIAGPAMLQQAALDAVKTWRYRPYLLNGQPVAVQTTVNVIFALPVLPPAEQQP